MSALTQPIYNDSHLTPHQQVELFEIAHQMKEAGLPAEFIAGAIRTALEFEGVADLVNLWANERDEAERNKIIADIQDLIDACHQHDKQEYAYIKFNDLEAIAKDIRAFKDSLLDTVSRHGGIKHLSELTHIPQPSLSRFFNSNAMPQRSTLLKIAKALQLDAVRIATQWAR